MKVYPFAEASDEIKAKLIGGDNAMTIYEYSYDDWLNHQYSDIPIMDKNGKAIKKDGRQDVRQLPYFRQTTDLFLGNCKMLNYISGYRFNNEDLPDDVRDIVLVIMDDEIRKIEAKQTDLFKSNTEKIFNYWVENRINRFLSENPRKPNQLFERELKQFKKLLKGKTPKKWMHSLFISDTTQISIGANIKTIKRSDGVKVTVNNLAPIAPKIKEYYDQYVVANAPDYTIVEPVWSGEKAIYTLQSISVAIGEYVDYLEGFKGDLLSTTDIKKDQEKGGKQEKAKTLRMALYYYYLVANGIEKINGIKEDWYKDVAREKGVSSINFKSKYISMCRTSDRVERGNVSHLSWVVRELEAYPEVMKKAENDLKEALGKS